MYHSYWSQKGSARGISLVETVVIAALFTLLMLAITSSIISFYRVNDYSIAQAYQVSNARQGVEQLIRDMREMTYADDGTFPLVDMGSTSISFYSDLDRDDSVEYIEYTLSSTTLYKNIYSASGSPPIYNMVTPESTHTISEYVQNNLQSIPIFVYYDEAGLPAHATTTATDIRYIQVSLIINIDPIRDPGQYMLRSSASLRNLKNIQ